MVKSITLLIVAGVLSALSDATPVALFPSAIKHPKIKEVPAFDLSSHVPDFKYKGNAPWPTSPKNMAAILTCPYGKITKKSNPVLLVHGTGSNGIESWGSVFAPMLLRDGYHPCWINLPQRSMQDIQLSAGYVAYNLHLLSSMAGGKQVAVVAHSSGNPVTQWGLRWWPSARRVTRAYVALAPDFQGVWTAKLVLLCNMLMHFGGKGLCSPSLWQQAHNSHFMDAFAKYARKALVPTTSVYTIGDEVVFPSFETSKLEGARRIQIQHVCPFRFVDHYTIVLDAVAYAITKDALNHDGIADRHRISLKNCFRFTPKGTVFDIKRELLAGYNDLKLGIYGQVTVPKEPTLMPYVTRGSI